MNNKVKVFFVGLSCVILFLSGFNLGMIHEKDKIQKGEEDRMKVCLNLGIAMGYLATRAGVNEKDLYSEGLKMFQMTLKK